MNTVNATTTSEVRENILAKGQLIMARKGFSAVGINEVLSAAQVPKGSFYHYFGSKDAFGEALLESYFDDYLRDMDAVLKAADMSMATRLMNYWQSWQANQAADQCQGKCLAVKLGAEVADLSEAMRLALKRGTASIVERIARAIKVGAEEGSLSVDGPAEETAQSLYELWLGASVMVKIVRSPQPFEGALAATRRILHLAQ